MVGLHCLRNSCQLFPVADATMPLTRMACNYRFQHRALHRHSWLVQKYTRLCWWSVHIKYGNTVQLEMVKLYLVFSAVRPDTSPAMSLPSLWPCPHPFGYVYAYVIFALNDEVLDSAAAASGTNVNRNSKVTGVEGCLHRFGRIHTLNNYWYRIRIHQALRGASASVEGCLHH